MTIKMNKFIVINLFILASKLRFGITLRFEKPIAKTIWDEACTTHSMMLNDCNWCRCNSGRYKCDARACNEVDMFGHFNDAIQEINVGMEGHGVWRTNKSPCQPNVHYHRGDLLCICTEVGSWPSSVCRDTFRILHEVQKVTDVMNFKNQECSPAKLYLIGCNVCFCPADGIPNPKFCTRKTCDKDDPVFNTPKDRGNAIEIYAHCTVDTKYKLGCKTCTCITNNRLLCNNCTNDGNQCNNREPGEKFNVDCNTCWCDDQGLIYCTVKKCLETRSPTEHYIDDTELQTVDAPNNDIDCTSGTKYKRDCNTCFCFTKHSGKRFGCTMDKCSEDHLPNDCVEGNKYKLNCLICHCIVHRGRKMEICHEDSKCKERNVKGLAHMKGYCEPLHLYNKDCNSCECLPDGKTIRCTANKCQTNVIENEKNPSTPKDDSREPLSVEIIPINKDVGRCATGKSFKIDCNICFCLSNGDVLCTTVDCRDRKSVV